MAKREYRGCTCRCGQGTWGMYAPGHDAKHVARLVAHVAEGWAEGYGGETGVRWRSAIKQLPTHRLQAKFRQAMINRANRERHAEISSMQDAGWQSRIELGAMVSGVDVAFEWMARRDNDGHAVTLAVVAGAMGLSRHAVNYRRS